MSFTGSVYGLQMEIFFFVNDFLVFLTKVLISIMCIMNFFTVFFFVFFSVEFQLHGGGGGGRSFFFFEIFFLKF